MEIFIITLISFFAIICSSAIIFTAIKTVKEQKECNNIFNSLLKIENEKQEQEQSYNNAIKLSKEYEKEIDNYFKTHPRKFKTPIICPIEYCNVYYLDNGEKIEYPIIKGSEWNQPLPPQNAVHMTLGLKKKYTYDNCEDCIYYYNCKQFDELFNSNK